MMMNPSVINVNSGNDYFSYDTRKYRKNSVGSSSDSKMSVNDDIEFLQSPQYKQKYIQM